MYPRKREDLEKFIKKNYSAFISEIEDLYTETKRLIDENKSLKTELENIKRSLESIEKSDTYNLSKSIGEYIDKRIRLMSVSPFEIDKIVGDEIQKHLSVDVDGYYEEYSGQGDHYHKVTINWY